MNNASNGVKKNNPDSGQKQPNIIINGQPPAKISLLAKNPRKNSRRALKTAVKIILAIILVLGTAIILRTKNLSDKIFVGQKTTFFQKIKAVLAGDSIKLVGENLGQINILLLGIGGESHDGPLLTDTQILAQIRPDIGQITLTSIPRDYLVELSEGAGAKKINNAFAEGFVRSNKDWGKAGAWARNAAEKISGLSIPYFAVVDFSGFEKAIDAIGGVDIIINRAFTDSAYPDKKYGYLPPLVFNQGLEHMNGARALQFSRSRHAPGPEGSDFARSQRQQKVIQAFKEKAISLRLATDTRKINTLLDVFAGHFHTNISPAEILRAYNIIKDKNIKNFLSLSLGPETKLVCPKILQDSGAYVLAPCPGKNEADIKNFFKNSFALGRLYQEKSIIWLGTSTGNRAAYQAADNKLKETNMTVWEVPFGGQPPGRNIVYQVNPKPATAEYIKNALNAMELTLPPPGIKIDKSKVDVVVILGEEK